MGIPDSNAAVAPTARSDRVSVGRPGQAMDMTILTDDYPHQVSGRQFPDMDRPVHAPRRRELAVRANGQAHEPAPMLSGFDRPTDRAFQFRRLAHERHPA